MYLLTCMSTDWKASALNVRIHVKIKCSFQLLILPRPIFIQSILETIHSWGLHHVLRQLVPETNYSVAVEMLSNNQSNTWFEQFQTVTT